jgi:hypothetical protein
MRAVVMASRKIFISSRSKWRAEELDKFFIIPALERGDRSYIADYIRNGGELNTPRLRKLFFDLVEKKWSWPRHRVRNDETSQRHLMIANFTFRRVDEGMSLEDAQYLAHKKFQVSRSTVRNACKRFGNIRARALEAAAQAKKSDTSL